MFLDTIAGETALLRAIISHRPVGPNKHFEMVSVLLSIKENAGKEYEAEAISGAQVWNKMKTLWDLEGIEDTFEESDSQGSTSELNDRHQIQEFDPISVLPLLPAMIEERGIEFKEQRSSSPENGKSKQKFNFSPGEDGEDGDMGGESDESELTEQEDDEQDLDSDPEDAPSPPSKRARSTRSVSVATSESTPISNKRGKIPASKKAVSRRGPGKRATQAPKR